MDESDDELRDETERAPNEGVRIIGAEEAARALEEGHAAGRRPDDAPRFGDVPQRPSGPRPAQRFPLPESVDPAEAVRRPAPAPSKAQSPPSPPQPRDTGGREVVVEPTSMEMPHWTEPPSGEVPRILAPEGGEVADDEAWSASSGTAPRWRDREEDWAESDLDDLSLEEDLRLGALDTSRSEHSDLFSFDEPQAVAEPVEDVTEPAPEREPGPARIRTRQPAERTPTSAPSGSDAGRRLVVGGGLAAVALIAFKLGSKPALFLAIVVVLLAAVEVYDVFRRAGYRTATLLGLTATLAMMVAAYGEGEVAIPLIIALTTIFTFFWYLFGVVQARPTINVAATLMGFLWVGFLGSFGALLLTYPNREGIAFLVAAVIATAAYDVGAWVVGNQMGSRPLAPAISPNKTVEGLIGGMALAVFATTVIVGALPGIHPWTVGKAFALGLVVAVVAPLGDLCQSMIKRDLGLKDMGSLLPGHGGVLDRFDSLLFVLPATYYLVKLVNLG
jgi:phosphatidate cytidylyltransferase